MSKTLHEPRALEPLRSIQCEAEQGKLELAKLLLQYIDIEDSMTGDAGARAFLLFTAAKCGCTAVVQQILDRETHEDATPWGYGFSCPTSTRLSLHLRKLQAKDIRI